MPKSRMTKRITTRIKNIKRPSSKRVPKLSKPRPKRRVY